MSAPGGVTPGGSFLGFGSPLMSGAGTGYHPRSPTPGDLSGAVEADKEPASVSARAHPVGLAEKLEVDSFIQKIDPEEHITSFTVTADPDHEEFELEPKAIIEQTIEISKGILETANQELHKVLSKVVAKSITYSVPDDGDESGPTQKTVEGRAKMAVAESFTKGGEAVATSNRYQVPVAVQSDGST